MVDRREEQLPVPRERRSGEDRRSGHRCAFISGPRKFLSENESFYRQIAYLFLACGYDTPVVLGFGSAKNPDEVILRLSQTERFNESSVLIADLTTPSEEVMHDLRYCLSEFRHVIVLLPEGEPLPLPNHDIYGERDRKTEEFLDPRVVPIRLGYSNPHRDRLARETPDPREKVLMYSSAKERVLGQIFNCISKWTLEHRIHRAEQATRQALPDLDERLERLRTGG